MYLRALSFVVQYLLDLHPQQADIGAVQIAKATAVAQVLYHQALGEQQERRLQQEVAEILQLH